MPGTLDGVVVSTDEGASWLPWRVMSKRLSKFLDMLVRRVILIALVALAAAQAAHYYPLMPARMASHFNGAGVPNGWSSPGQFFAIMLVVELLLAGSLMLASPFRRLSDDMINLPNKDYWLAPERRQATFDRFSSLMLEFGIMTQLLMLYVVQLTMWANQVSPPLLSPKIVTALLVYLGATVLWVIRMVVSFARPK